MKVANIASPLDHSIKPKGSINTGARNHPLRRQVVKTWFGLPQIATLCFLDRADTACELRKRAGDCGGAITVSNHSDPSLLLEATVLIQRERRPDLVEKLIQLAGDQQVFMHR